MLTLLVGNCKNKHAIDSFLGKQKEGHVINEIGKYIAV